MLSDPDHDQLPEHSAEVQERFQALVAEVHRRRQLLLDAQELANDFHRTQRPLSAWLDDASAQVTALCKVVTSKEEIEANIAKQEVGSFKSVCFGNLLKKRQTIYRFTLESINSFLCLLVKNCLCLQE